jgi:hypothetical protein
MTIFIVYDSLLEKVISAHKSSYSAIKRCNEMDEKEKRYTNNYYHHHYDEYELED